MTLLHEALTENQASSDAAQIGALYLIAGALLLLAAGGLS